MRLIKARPLRDEHHETHGVAECAVRADVRRMAGRFAQDAALRGRQGAPRCGDHRRQGALQPPPALRHHRRAVRRAEGHRRRVLRRRPTPWPARPASSSTSWRASTSTRRRASRSRRSSTPSPRARSRRTPPSCSTSRAAARQHFKEGKELWYLRPSHVFPLEPRHGRRGRQGRGAACEKHCRIARYTDCPHLRLRRSPVGSGENFLPGIFFAGFPADSCRRECAPLRRTFLAPAGDAALPGSRLSRCRPLPVPRAFPRLAALHRR